MGNGKWLHYPLAFIYSACETTKNMKRRLSLLAVSIIATLSYAYDVCVENVYYNVDALNRTASVTYKDRSFNSYSGEVKIAKKVECNGVKYEVTSIGDSAFYQCKDLVSIAIHKNITEIGNGAFNACSGLASINIPKSVTKIGNYAFYACSNLTSITIHKNVESIGTGAFAGCTALADLDVDRGNPVYRVEDGILYDKGKTHLLGCIGSKSGSYVVPSTVMTLDNAAFAGCTQITSVEFPNTIENIGDSLFMGCSSLTTMRIPYTVQHIGSYAFANSGLSSIEISNRVLDVGNYAFSNCNDLALVIMHCATKKGKNIFADCPRFDLIEIGNPANLMIVNGLHYDVNFDKKEAIVLKSDKPYSGDVVIPETFTFKDTQYKITAIAEEAFNGCDKLTSITIPRYVKTMGLAAFNDCEALTAVHISDLAAWCEIDFKPCDYDECTAITNPLNYAHKLYLNGKLVQELVIPESVTRVSQMAFEECTSLTSVTIPNTVTSIGHGAFSGCTGLKSIVVPNSIKTIDDYTFSCCSNLTSVEIPASVEAIGGCAFYGCEKLTAVDIPSSVRKIGCGAFQECKGLTSIVIPKGVTSIEDDVFYKCSNLTSITIPDGVTAIGNYAFKDCYNLTDLQLPKFLRSVGDYAFDGCRSLSSSMDIPIFASIGDQAFPYNIHANPRPVISRDFFGLTLGESSKQQAISTFLEKHADIALNTKKILYVNNVDYEGKHFDNLVLSFYGGALSSVSLSDGKNFNSTLTSSKRKELTDYYTRKYPDNRYYVFNTEPLFDDDITRLLILDGSLVFTDVELEKQSSKAEADRYREIHPFTDRRISKDVLGCTLGKSSRQQVVDTLKAIGLQIMEDYSPDSIAFSGVTHEGVEFGKVTANFFEGTLMMLSFKGNDRQLSRSDRDALESHFAPMYAAYDMRNGLPDLSSETAVSYFDDATRLSITSDGLYYIDCALQEKWLGYLLRSIRGKHEVSPSMKYIVDSFNKMYEKIEQETNK